MLLFSLRSNSLHKTVSNTGVVGFFLFTQLRGRKIITKKQKRKEHRRDAFVTKLPSRWRRIQDQNSKNVCMTSACDTYKTHHRRCENNGL